MRLGTKLRRVVTLSTATNKLRQMSIADYERKFRVAIQDCKSITALLDKIQEASTQHLKVYGAVRRMVLTVLLVVVCVASSPNIQGKTRSPSLFSPICVCSSRRLWVSGWHIP